MVVPATRGIDRFNIAGCSLSGWMMSFKTGTASPVRRPFCRQLEACLKLWLEDTPR